ncbi:MAG: viologen exporter family transport system permease protein [Frankiaceae bacterium]|nr:viologen exporter family transport system permease protein [Frankiaceae bacterium]
MTATQTQPGTHRPADRGAVAARLGRARHTRLVIRKVTAVNIRAILEYRGDTAVWILFGILWQTSTLIFAAVLITRFNGLGGWPSIGVVLIAGMRLLSHGFYVLIFYNFGTLPQLIDEGRFDGYFLRPVPIFTQLLLSSFSANAFGDLLVAFTLCAVALPQIAIHWTLGKALFLLAGVISGTLIEASIQLIVACSVLRSPGTRAVPAFIDEMFGTFGNYPLTILPGVLQGVFTFVLPLAFVAYFPVSVVLHLTPHNAFLSFLAHVSPLVGLLLFLLARWIWKRSLRNYASVGG